MNSTSMIGAVIITLSLLSYGLGSISLQRFKMITPGVVLFLTMGVIFDIAATCFMIVGSDNSPFTKHGLIGYSALLIMFVDTILIWRLYLKKKMNAPVNGRFMLFSKIAYGWWVIAYLAGSLIVIWS